MTHRTSDSEPVPPTRPPGEPRSSDEELAALFAIGALTDSERLEIELRLASGDESLRADVQSWDEVVAALGTTLEPVMPHPRIKSALLSRIEQESIVAVDHSSPETTSAPLDKIVLRASEARWRSAGLPGAQLRLLNCNRQLGRVTTLLSLAPGSRFPSHHHTGEEECFVISGDLIDGDLVLAPGDYVRSFAGSDHQELTSRTGCVCLIVTSIEPKHV